MTNEKIIYTFTSIGTSTDKKIARMATILDRADGTEAVALISFLGSGYFMVVVGADNGIRRQMKHAGIKPIYETNVHAGHTAMLIPLEDFLTNPMPDSSFRQKQPLAGFILKQIGPIRARARYPTNSIEPKKSKMNGAMTCEQREALARAAGFQVPFGC